MTPSAKADKVDLLGRGRTQRGGDAPFGFSGLSGDLDLSHIARIASKKPPPGPVPPETHLTGPNLILHFGYPAETHKVLTEDGYYVTIFRIPWSPKLGPANESRPVVFLQHGVLQTADQWLFRGPGRDLPFLLSDLGFDVWMGNYRGSTYSRKHAYLSPKKLRFWDFTWNENGLFDLPAMLDYVGAVTGQPSMFYIGHSMGTTTLLALLAERPEYNRRIRGAFLLAPVAYFQHTWGPLAQARSIAPLLTSQPNNRLIGEALPRGAGNMCVGAVPLCALVHNLGSGSSPGEYNATVFKILFGHYPSGASFGQLLHYVQILVSGEFKMFDYGPRENLARYGQTTPPFYALSNVRAPIYLNYAEGDPLSPPKDVLRLAKEVPGVRKLMKVPLKDFGHVDHLYATHSYELEYKGIIDIMLVMPPAADLTSGDGNAVSGPGCEPEGELQASEVKRWVG
ncbi:lipase 3-like [Thrips palmi]|uniref:Lipase 3-like n=1 Tax=Thrips palmi TaxID=161013 RepID=A0A6P8ZN64_THRPL|nr:lipase 3-like [Thrips palmi]